MTSGLFFAFTKEGLPFIKERAREEASTTRAKRFSSFSKQSSTVTRAIDSPGETKGTGKLVAIGVARNLVGNCSNSLNNFQWALAGGRRRRRATVDVRVRPPPSGYLRRFSGSAAA